MVSPEKVILNFSIKNCQKNYFYVIKVSTLNLSLGQVGEFETEKIECLEDNKEIVFKNNIVYYYHFDKKQKLIIKTIKIIPVNNEYKNKENERHTTLSSLVASPNSTYERPLNKEFPEQDVLCIKLTKINNKKGENDSIFEFIKSGIKLSIFVSMDFSNRKNQQNIKESINNYTNIIAQVTDESLKKIFKLHDHSFTERELKNIKLIFSYGQSNVENCKCKKDSNFISFYTNLSEKLQKSKWEAEEEFKNIIENNLENLTKIFNNNNLDQGELQAKSEIHNNAEERLEKFKKEMHEKSDKIYSETEIGRAHV